MSSPGPTQPPSDKPFKYLMGDIACSTHSKAQLLDELLAMLKGDVGPRNTILYVNPHVFNLAREDPGLRKALAEARITSADGMGIVWCSSMFLKGRLAERCNMTEVFREFLADARFPRRRAVLIGASDDEAGRAAAEINRVSLHLQVVRHVSGFLKADDYKRFLGEAGEFDVILLGMGTPKSEHIGQVLADAYPRTVIWHIGGGTVMFYAGTLREAPAWMRKRGLQWVHRLALEPRRMWRRYTVGTLRYLFRVVGLWRQRGYPWQSKDADVVEGPSQPKMEMTATVRGPASGGPAASAKLRIAIIGDRGIPARYSGFSTLVEELAVRLVADHDMDVTVYGRRPYFDHHPATYRGVRLVWMSSPGGKGLESIVHTNRAVVHAAIAASYDLVLILDPANGPFCLPLKARQVPVVYHTDGLGWKRTKWSPLQRRYYKWSESITSRLADWLVTDSHAMVAYYRDGYGVPCTYIPYGAIVGDPPDATVLERFGLRAGEYYLQVARLEPENNSLFVIREFKRSRTHRPLVVVGGVPYDSAYARAVRAEGDERVKTVGSVFESGHLNALWQNCRAYIHAHEVGGTNPSLLRAMGARCACLPLGVEFNREVVGHDVPYFTHEPGSLSALIDRLDDDATALSTLAVNLQVRARELYRWDAVAAAYAALFRDIVGLRRAGGSVASLATIDYYRPRDFSGNWEDWPVRNNADPAAAAAPLVGPAKNHG